MDDTGLLSGLFGQLNEYSRAINRVLVDLKSTDGSSSFTPPAMIKELISHLHEPLHADLGPQSLAAGLEREVVHCSPDAVSRLRQAVESGHPYPHLIEDLESLARLVRAQQSDTYARLRSPA